MKQFCNQISFNFFGGGFCRLLGGHLSRGGGLLSDGLMSGWLLSGGLLSCLHIAQVWIIIYSGICVFST